ncbi:WXG100 family type VII secretion target [Nocardioides marmotae]|uniref:ESAT-6-like protein n=1 Tax=Nocardioides marmotae TaxID=2663857 RepID=A0A6I3JDE7_9ACTN|nr:WXG100 family type VII secretion target [Nocardioides marmotae]MCR6032466.1 WXG100 family type VII secretion target [Gordonia jinghuaiqii]MBC9734245.1 WXG100 family type VII secretion target [Nocardioides marmotae]MTB85347.1 WXG100 family type VII secretion target [Nocardioides marmotae]MTB96115.1 WXG100 family type VII secretion target [Nocardioides marmotae]QKD99806.1 WXG100 family type VII secretion target [Nocardioides marmotae]
MNLDGIRVNHAGLDTAAADLMQAVKNIDDRLNRLESELAPLRSDWDGQAQQAYHVAKQKWDGAITEMRNILTQTSQAVSQSNTDYAAADKRGAASFGG